MEIAQPAVAKREKTTEIAVQTKKETDFPVSFPVFRFLSLFVADLLFGLCGAIAALCLTHTLFLLPITRRQTKGLAEGAGKMQLILITN